MNSSHLVVAALTDYVDNRELALAIWVTVGVLACLIIPSTRPSIIAVLRALFLSILSLYLLALVLNTVLLVWISSEVGLWEKGLTGEVVLWFFSTAFVSFINLNRDVKRPHFARRMALESVSAAVFLDFFVNLHPFSFPVEIVLIPVIVMLVALATVAETNPEHAVVARLMNRLIMLFSLLAILYVVQWLIFDFDSIDWASVGKTLGAPIWLTLGSVPIFCTFRWFVAFGELAGAIRMEAWRVTQSGVVDETPHKLRPKLAVLRRARFQLEPMLGWEKDRQVLRPLVLAPSNRQADEIVCAELNRRSRSAGDLD
jgi:hypothetical protein